MKKFIYMTVAALVMLTTLSCEKEKLSPKDNPSSVEKVDMEFNAETVGAEKTTVKDGVVAIWSENDVIKVFTDKDTQGSQCAITKGAGTQIATFSGQCAKEGPWTAVCPADKATGFNNGTVTLTMPETQTYALNTFASGALPCVAFSDNANFVFPHSFGVLKLSLITRPEKIEVIKSITITDKSGAKLNGTFTVNPSVSPVATKSGADGTSSITLDCSGSTVVLTYMEPKDFWFVVPEGAFANGLDVTITSSKDIESKFSTTQANTITAGKIKVMPIKSIEFILPEIGRGTATAIINGVETPVNWIQLWEDGPKFAESNMSGTFCWGGLEPGSTYSPYVFYDIQQTSYDVASSTWGPDWCIPTRDEMKYLIDNCTMVWKNAEDSGYGVDGCLVTGIGLYSGNSLFLPVTTTHYYGERRAAYWTSTPQQGSAHLCNQLQIWSENPYPKSNSSITGESDYDLVAIRPIYKKAPVISGEAERTDGEMVQWVMMWPGGPKWAKYNVGANTELEAGGYYLWGDDLNQEEDLWGFGQPSYATTSIQGTEDDTAKSLWGDNWLMPTKDDLQGLINNCWSEYVTNYNGSGMDGRLYHGAGNCESNTLFLPEAGQCLRGSCRDKNYFGYYWTADPCANEKAYGLYVVINSSHSLEQFSRRDGYQVRAILHE